MAAPIGPAVPTLNARQALSRLPGSATKGLAEGMLRDLIVGGRNLTQGRIRRAARNLRTLARYLTGPPAGDLVRRYEVSRPEN